MNEWQDKFAAWWQNQTERDQKVLLIGGGVSAVLFVLLVLVTPLWRSHREADELLERRTDNLQEMLRIEREVAAQPRSGAGRGHGRPLGELSPIALIQNSAARAGVKDKLRDIRPGATEEVGRSRYTTVNFQMADLTMKEYVDMLYELEIASGYDVEFIKFQADRRERGTARSEISAEIRLLQ